MPSLETLRLSIDAVNSFLSPRVTGSLASGVACAQMTQGRGDGPHNALGNWLRDLRVRAGFDSQPRAELRARHLGLRTVTQGKLSYAERGWNALPEPQLLRDLAELYDVPYAELVARCVQAQYDVEMWPARPGEPRPEIRVEPALTTEEELLLGLVRSIADKGTRRDFMKMVAVAHAGLVAGGQIDRAAAPQAAGEASSPPRGKVIPIRSRKRKLKPKSP